MPKFYFDFRQGQEHLIDRTGLELANVEDAYLKAFEAAQAMWSELMTERRDPFRCSFEVRSQQNEILFTFPFCEVLECCADRRGNSAIRRSLVEVAQTHNFALRVNNDFVRELEVTRERLLESRELLMRAI